MSNIGNVSPRLRATATRTTHLVAALLIAWALISLMVEAGLLALWAAVHFGATIPQAAFAGLAASGLVLWGASQTISIRTDDAESHD